MARVALVTGGTRGIGEAISLALKEAGYTVAANYGGNDEKARAFTEQTGIKSFRWNVADFEACQAGVAQVEAEVGPVEVLVNNAGITRDASFLKLTPEAWREVIDVNLNSVFYMTKAVFPGMRERKWGRIINISSVNGQQGMFGQANYASTKAALFGFTKTLAQESARNGITANVVAPGYINTDMVQAMPKEAVDKMVSAIPVGRLGRTDEVARAVLFLADENAGFITGSTLSINGGQYLA
jgi:acetoacetyl-CoA reductase